MSMEKLCRDNLLHLTVTDDFITGYCDGNIAFKKLMDDLKAVGQAFAVRRSRDYLALNAAKQLDDHDDHDYTRNG
jgi:hypothetical protein